MTISKNQRAGRSLSADGLLPRWDALLFSAATLLNGFVAFCILRANRYYIDDLGRVHSGYIGWTGDGRPLTSLIMQALNMGAPLTDLTPLPQCLAALVLSWCVLLVARKFDIRDKALAVLAVFPLGASPFFLENLSYKFDVLAMVLSVALALLAVAETPTRGRRMAWGALLLLGTLCLYQPALNVFLVFSMLEFLLLLWWREAPVKLWQQASGRLAQAVAAIIPYKLISLVVLRNAYAEAHSGLVGLGQWSICQINARDYWDLFMQAMSDRGAWAFGAVLVAGLALSLLVGLRYFALAWRASGAAGRAWRLLLALLLPPAFALCAVGVLLFLSNAPIVPRVMIGAGAMACASLVLLCVVARTFNVHRWVLRGLLLAPAYSMLLLAVVYGNAMLAQGDYEDRVSTSLSDDFVNVAARYEIRGKPLSQYVLVGSVDHAPVLDVAMKEYPFLSTLVPVYLRANWGWVADLFSQYDIRQSWDSLPSDLNEAVKRMCERPPVRITANYRLYVVDSFAVVAFNDVPACRMDQLLQPVQSSQPMNNPKADVHEEPLRPFDIRPPAEQR